MLPGDPAQMMLGQNEDSGQIAAVKAKYGFDKPISTQYLYYLNDLSPISFHSTNNGNYTFLSDGKYKTSKLFTIGETATVLKFPYLRESFTKQGKKVSQVIGETLPNTVVVGGFSNRDRYCTRDFSRHCFCSVQRPMGSIRPFRFLVLSE